MAGMPDPFNGTSASHVTFSDLPAGATVIARGSASGEPDARRLRPWGGTRRRRRPAGRVRLRERPGHRAHPRERRAVRRGLHRLRRRAVAVRIRHRGHDRPRRLDGYRHVGRRHRARARRLSGARRHPDERSGQRGQARPGDAGRVCLPAGRQQRRQAVRGDRRDRVRRRPGVQAGTGGPRRAGWAGCVAIGHGGFDDLRLGRQERDPEDEPRHRRDRRGRPLPGSSRGRERLPVHRPRGQRTRSSSTSPS